MSNTGSDGLGFDVTVNGSQGRKELDALLKKVRALGTAATESGAAIDESTVQAAKDYNRLAAQIAIAIKTEESLTASVEQTRAARARANAAVSNAKVATTKVGTANTNDELVREKLVGQQITNNARLRQQANADLESQSRVALTNDKRQELAETRAVKQQQQRVKAVQDVKKQQDAAWASKERQDAADVRNAARVKAQTDAMFAAREAGRAKDNAAIDRAAAKEIAEQQAIERATEKRLAKETAAQEAAQKANARRTQDNLYNDYMAHQDASSVSNINATRYALYDVASTALIVGGAITAIGVAASITASKFEYSFSGVQRAAELTGSQIDSVKQQLIGLTESTPTNFTDVANIAQLGAQMGIASDNLVAFSGTVSKFSATTNASVDTTAQTFGRLSNLLDVPASKFDNLGSSIAEVGVKSVATETEILSTTQQIAGAAAVYGFTADQVVGLGAAFASLAIAPEAARGSVTRIFGDIEKAVSAGGKDLEAYAQIMGTTSESAATLWKQNPSAFFQKLVAGLSQSKDLLKDLSDIGANDVRDQNLLQRLAKSPDVLNQSLQVANQSYQQGTYLQQAYAVQTDNLQSKVAILGNTFAALANSAGGPLNEALKLGVDILTFLIKTVADSNPVLLGIVTAIITIVGAFILMKGAQAAAIAGLLAIQTVLRNMGAEAKITGINLASLNAVMKETAGLATAGGTSVAGATGKIKGFGSAIVGLGKSTLVLAAIAAAFTALNWVIDEGSKAFESNSQKASDYFGSFDGLGAAMQEDTKAVKDGGAVYATFTSNLDSQKGKQDETATSAAGLATVLGDAGVAAETASGQALSASLKFGDASLNFLKQQLQQSEEFKKATGNQKFVQYWQTIGADMDTALKIAATKGKEGVAKYFADLETEAMRQGKTLPADYHFDFLSQLTGDAPDAVEEAKSKLIGALGGVGEQAQQVANQQSILGVETDTTNQQLKAQGDDAETLAPKLDNLKSSVDNLFSGITTEGDFYDSMNGLFQALYDSDNQFNTFSDTGRAAFSALQDSIVATIDYGASLGQSSADSLVPLFVTLQQQGVDTTKLLQQLASSPIVYSADIDISALQQKLGFLATGTRHLNGVQTELVNVMSSTVAPARAQAGALHKTASSAKEAAKEVKTLSQYADDLGTVFKNAFDIRFGGLKALDDVQSKWNDISSANAKATKDLEGYRVELQKLSSDKETLTYQLGVAINYGDTLRQSDIQAQLAQNAQDMADKQAQADEATGTLNKSLVGNSDAAIKNRSTILDLVSSYEDYVKELANSGLSQADLAAKTAQLKQDFIAQATQLGFNASQLDTYTAAFDDLTYTINNVPRNITVDADTNPAKRALAEWLATAGAAHASPTIGATDPYGSGVRDGKEWADGVAASRQLRSRQGINGKEYQYFNPNTGAVSPWMYATGGKAGWKSGTTNYLADGGYPKMASRGTDQMPAMLSLGERIIRNPAVDHYGDKFFDDVNSMKYKPQSSAPIIVQGAQMPASMVVELSPTDRALIAAGKAVTAVVRPSVIADATNTTNNDTTRRGA